MRTIFGNSPPGAKKHIFSSITGFGAIKYRVNSVALMVIPMTPVSRRPGSPDIHVTEWPDTLFEGQHFGHFTHL
jgi:hypothetical protein